VKKLFFLISLSTIFFLGCSNKSYIDVNTQQEQAIVSTQKTKVEIEDNSALLFMATYLNNMEKYSGNQTGMIVLSYYYSPSLPEIRLVLDKPMIKVNGESVEVLELENNNEMLEDVPVNNKWSRYFLVLFEKKAGDILNVTAEIYPFPQALLMLPKEP
jgi:hypothetical protein